MTGATWLQRPITVETRNRQTLSMLQAAIRRYPGEVGRIGDAYTVLTDRAAKELSVITGYV